MGVKALGIAMKLTLSGVNQFVYPQTWLFAILVTTFLLTQMNYLNKVTAHFGLFSFLLFSAMIFQEIHFSSSPFLILQSLYELNSKRSCCYIIMNTVQFD